MTWEEFVRHIKEQMDKYGILEDMEIEYIDISFPCKSHDTCIPEIYYDEKEKTIAIH